MSSSLTGVFHQEMVNYQLKPSYEYQQPAYKSYSWGKKVVLKYSFKSISRSVLMVIKVMKEILEKRIKVTVLYATETGKSEFLSEKLTNTLRQHFFVTFKRMDEYDFDSEIEKERILFLVASTFGNGDPPDSGRDFWKSISSRLRKMKNSSDDTEKEKLKLRNLHFSVFGLGSSLYPTFGAFGINLDKTLYQLEGKRLRPVTLGDELRGQQKMFSVWREKVSGQVVNRFVHGAKSEGEDCNEILLPSEVGDREAFDDDYFNTDLFRLYAVSATKSSSSGLSGGDALHQQDMLTKIHGEKKFPTIFPMKVVSRSRLLPIKNEYNRQTILVKMRASNAMSKPFVNYKPGDHLGVFPSNPTPIVEALLNRTFKDNPTKQSFLIQDSYFQVSFILVVEVDHSFLSIFYSLPQVSPVVVVQSRDSLEDSWVNTSRLPPCTLKEALTHYLDICACPTPRLLNALSNLANDRWDVFRLKKLSQEPESYKSWRSFHSPNLLDVLNEYPSLHVTPEFLIMRLPLLQPRVYSISSSMSVHPEEVHLTVSLVQWTPQSHKNSTSRLIKEGVSTSFLDGIPESAIPCFIRPALQFRLPESISTPIIMICAGSGIAPFRSFWQERQVRVMEITGGRRLSMAASSGRESIGKAILFFGCRDMKVDQLYEKEIEDLLSRGVLHDAFIATSRGGVKRQYVQNELLDQRTLVYWMLEMEKAHVYVCGDALMAHGVRQSLIKILENDQHKSNGQDMLDDLRDEGRYHEDIYGILKS